MNNIILGLKFFCLSTGSSSSLQLLVCLYPKSIPEFFLHFNQKFRILISCWNSKKANTYLYFHPKLSIYPKYFTCTFSILSFTPLIYVWWINKSSNMWIYSVVVKARNHQCLWWYILPALSLLLPPGFPLKP